MTLQLTTPKPKYLPSVRAAIAEYTAAPSEFEIHAVRNMLDAAQTDFTAYFETVRNESLGINLKPNRVTHTVFWLVDDDKYIGTFDLRHTLTPNLEQVGGHIAYQIRPSEQGKGYALAGLKLCLEEARKIGLEKVLITCTQKNLASYAVMHKAMLEIGGIEAPHAVVNGVSERRVWVWTQKRSGKIRQLVIAVIKKENKVLAIPCYDSVKNEKFYRLPGGGIEFGETFEQALKREIKEEIGANIIIGKQLGVFENIFIFNGKQGHEIIIAYEAALPPEYMAQDKIAMIEAEFAGYFYEFTEITPDKRIYPKILG